MLFPLGVPFNASPTHLPPYVQYTVPVHTTYMAGLGFSSTLLLLIFRPRIEGLIAYVTQNK